MATSNSKWLAPPLALVLIIASLVRFSGDASSFAPSMAQRRPFVSTNRAGAMHATPIAQVPDGGTGDTRRPKSVSGAAKKGRAAVLVLVRTVAAATKVVVNLTGSCAFARRRPVLVLVGEDCPLEDILDHPERCSRLRTRRRLEVPHAMCANFAKGEPCTVEAVDVTPEFWASLPAAGEGRSDSMAGPGGKQWRDTMLGRWGWGYRAMCAFYASGIFNVPRVQELEYYMRLDDDSSFVCPSDDYDP